ncbi:MAG: serine/threonine protein kinase [Gammaproteobacteria bacterium]|nr:serine/threonine protein kinase [Gammaproteobacteria bacterium]
MNATVLHPFEALTPDFILAAVEAQGFVTDGRLLALNSYENRVYQVGIEDGEPLIAKFYRPLRWSDAALREEHEFTFDLARQGLPVVAPLGDEPRRSLRHVGEFRLALFPRRGGRAPDLDRREVLVTMGRVLARMHTVGFGRPFRHRPAIDVQHFGVESVDYVLAHCLPADLRPAYESLARDLLGLCRDRFAHCEGVAWRRVHGDCHGGNLLWRDDAPHFVDFDDARMAPAVQDVWMLLSGHPEEQRAQLAAVLEGYHEFADFDLRELSLIEPLRTLRMLHYAAWLGRRWDDPAFPLAFPWFNTQAYWERHVLELREQFAALSEPLWAADLLH